MFCRGGADNVFHHCKMCSNRKETLLCGILWFRSFAKRSETKYPCEKKINWAGGGQSLEEDGAREQVV